MKSFKLLLILILLVCITCCGKGTSGKSKDVNITTVSGLGSSQLIDVNTFINSTYPAIGTTTTDQWNGYQSDFFTNIDNGNYSKIIMIGHSFGCAAIVDTAAKIPKVDLIILIDPVAYNWGNLFIPPTVEKVIVFRRTETIGPVRADISGIMPIIKYDVPNTSHNSIPHDPSIFPIMKTAIDAVLD